MTEPITETETEVIEATQEAPAEAPPQLVLRRPDLRDLPDPQSLLPEGYHLRTRQESDLPRLTALMVRAYPEIEWNEQKVADALIGDQSVKKTFIIEQNGTLIATASARWQPERYPGEGYVHWVASDPEHRGKRLGYIATLAVLHEFAAWDATSAVLHTDDFRVPAIKVYLNLGFVPVLNHPSFPERWQKLTTVLGEIPGISPA
ncbi:MAG: hypothetical protein OHK0029_15170 [Armatimonadaceae bacterium]